MAYKLISETSTGPRPRDADNDQDPLPEPVRTVGEMAALRLSLGLSEALGQAADRLDRQDAAPPSLNELEITGEAAALARTWRHEIVQDFRRHFATRHARACHHKPSLLSGYVIDFDIRHLRIVQHDRLDDSLVPGLMAESIHHAGWNCLQTLADAYARLLDAPGLSTRDMPVAPNLIEAALAEALREQGGRHEAKDRLMKALCDVFPRRVADTLQDLRDFMAGRQPGMAEAPAPLNADDPGEVDPDSDTFLAYPPANAGITTSPAPLGSEADPGAQAPSPAPMENLRQQLFERLARLQARFRPIVEDSVLATAPDQEDMAGDWPAPTPRRTLATPLRELKPGTWMEIQEPGTAAQTLKLAWISPLRNLFLLTRHQGQRARSLNAETLESLLQSGWARVVPAPDEETQDLPPQAGPQRNSA